MPSLSKSWREEFYAESRVFEGLNKDGWCRRGDKSEKIDIDCESIKKTLAAIMIVNLKNQG